jgi:hypothetical protein
MVADSSVYDAVWDGSLVCLGVVIDAILTAKIGKLPRESAFSAGIVAQIATNPTRNPLGQL